MEQLHEKRRITLFNVVYRTPNGKIDLFENFLKILFKSTRVTKKTATVIEHIITNSFVENTFKAAIIKSDVSGHFRICIFIPSTNLFTKNDVIYQIKEALIFLQNLYQYDWDTVKTRQDANEAYSSFILTFSIIYDTFFL